MQQLFMVTANNEKLMDNYGKKTSKFIAANNFSAFLFSHYFL